MPDAYLYTTSNEGKVGQWTYKGPEKMWVFMRKADNKRSGEIRYSYEIEDDFVPAAHEYMVKVNCEENPLLCELMEVHQDTLKQINKDLFFESPIYYKLFSFSSPFLWPNKFSLPHSQFIIFCPFFIIQIFF